METIKAINDIHEEYKRAAREHAPFNSTHEGYAVILQGVEILWLDIRLFEPSKDLKRDATELAAAVLKFLVDCCDD